jgi:hypothetical protein
MLLIVYGFISVELVSANIRINEVYPNPPGSPEVDEFIEIYNVGDVAIDIYGWTIHDTIGSSKEYIFPQVIVEPKQFFVLKNSQSQIVLNNTADGLVLKSSQGEIIDEMQFENSEESFSYGRYPDGVGTEFISMSTSEGLTNISPPTPTSTPTTSPTPSKTPTPTKTPTPLKTTFPTNTSVPVVTPTTTVTSFENIEIRGISDNMISKTASVSSSAGYLYDKDRSKLTTDKKSLPVDILGIQDRKGGISILLGGVLLLSACGILVFRKYAYRLFK